MKTRTWREQAGTYACTALAAAALVGCGGAPSGGDSVAIDVDGIPELYAPLSPWNGTDGACTVTQGGTTAAPTFTVVLDYPTAGGTLVLSKRVADSAVLLNGYPTNDFTNTSCQIGSTGAAPLITATKLKALTINGASGVVDTLILDYLNGSFGAVGASAGVPDGTRGILVDLGGGDTTTPVPDAVKIRGQAGADSIVLGTKSASSGQVDISMVTAAAVDIEIQGVVGTAAAVTGTNDGRTSDPAFTIASAGGNDTFRFGPTRAATETCGSTTETDSVAGAALEFPVTVFGGDGNDTFNMGATVKSDATDASVSAAGTKFGDVIVNGGAGTDTVSYAERAAALYVGPDGVAKSGDRTGELPAREGDTIKTDIETVVGGLCGDVMVAATNVDGNTVTLNGGPGDDYFVDASASLKTVFTGGAGTDTVTYAGRSADLTVTVGAGVNDGDGAASFTINGAAVTGGEKDDVGATIEQVLGGDGDDAITAAPTGSVLCGGLGDDTLTGGAGPDIFRAVVFGVVTFNPDACVPGDAALTCVGGTAANPNTTSLLCDEAGTDTRVGGAGVDLVDFSNLGADNPSPCQNINDGTNSLIQDPTDAADAFVSPTAEGVGSSGTHFVASSAIENVWGSCGDDFIDGNSLANELVGNGGNDELTAGGGDDTIEGNGAGATDAVDCGDGDDITVNVDAATSPVDCEL